MESMYLLDLIYLIAIVLLSPWLVWRSVKTGRYRSDLAAKLLGWTEVPNPGKKRVAWFHAVSVGEVNLLGTLVPAFHKRHPDWLIVISATTDTGLAEARKRFDQFPVLAWPFDFSWAVNAALQTVQPSVIVLTESELWPNFLHATKGQKVPVIVVNARMSPRSFKRLKQIAGLARNWLFESITRFAVQEQEYADRLRKLGVASEKIVVTGSVKYDGAMKDRDTAKTAMLRRLLGMSEAGPLVWLAGSTHAPEEAIVLGVFSRLRVQFPNLRVVLVPRHPDRFEEVAKQVEESGLSYIRRSKVVEALPEMPAVVLFDSVGELAAAWGLADVGFSGGSLDGRRGGQSMIEPAGYGVPCLFGPHVWNFKDSARRLVETGGAVMVKNEEELESELAKLLANPDLRRQMGTLAEELVRSQQGATVRTLEAIEALLYPSAMSHAA
jgi:3-deoxy-D-manno-octulosonic-acid transferase